MNNHTAYQILAAFQIALLIAAVSIAAFGAPTWAWAILVAQYLYISHNRWQISRGK